MNAVKTALVIGGGIAGPVAALALRKAGIDATVFEAYASSADGVGGMLTIAPNGLNALKIIGADEAVCAVGQPMQRMAMADERGRTLGEFAGVPGLPPSRVLWRSDLYRALHDRAVASGVRIEHGKRLVSVDDAPDGITAHFADGTSARGDVLLGADGIRSTVRALIDPNAPGPECVPLIGFGGYADITGLGKPDAMYFVFGKRAFLGHWSTPDGRTAWFGNLPHAEPMTTAQVRETPAAEWLRLLREIYADDVPGRDLLDNTCAENLLSFGSMEIMPSVPHWHRGRMVLVGDSAHAPSSSSGQGASLAVESAIQLARCLRDLPDVPTAFAAYERLRRPRVQKIAEAAAKVNRQKAPGPVAKMLMRFIMPIAMKTFAKPEKRLGPEQGYRIDWDERVAA